MDCSTSEDVSPSDFDFFKRARYMRVGTQGTQRAYLHHTVQLGSVVSAVVARAPNDIDNSGRVQVVSDGDGICRFFAVF